MADVVIEITHRAYAPTRARVWIRCRILALFSGSIINPRVLDEHLGPLWGTEYEGGEMRVKEWSHPDKGSVERRVKEDIDALARALKDRQETTRIELAIDSHEGLVELRREITRTPVASLVR